MKEFPDGRNCGPPVLSAGLPMLKKDQGKPEPPASKLTAVPIQASPSRSERLASRRRFSRGGTAPFGSWCSLPARGRRIAMATNRPSKTTPLSCLARDSPRGALPHRFDRRGIGESRKTAPKEEDLTIDMLAEDVVEWIKLLRKDQRFSRIGIVGHSEGARLVGTLAARIAAADAFVSLANVGRKVDVVLPRSNWRRTFQRTMKEKSDKIIDELVAGRTFAEIPKELAAFISAECAAVLDLEI